MKEICIIKRKRISGLLLCSESGYIESKKNPYMVNVQEYNDCSYKGGTNEGRV